MRAALGLQPGFGVWASVTFLHMYVLTVRLRQFAAEHAAVWRQHLVDHWSYAAEDRLAVLHQMSAAGPRQKQLQALFEQWRGVQVAYDEGLVSGDAVLAAALWRNLFHCDERVDFAALALVVSYMRREIKRLEDATDVRIFGGTWTFGQSPEAERLVVRAPSSAMVNAA